MTAFEISEYWDKSVQIDAVGVCKDGWIDLGERNWGDSAGAISELERKIPLFPNPANATIGRRPFSKNSPKSRKTPDKIRIHTRADRYDGVLHDVP